MSNAHKNNLFSAMVIHLFIVPPAVQMYQSHVFQFHNQHSNPMFQHISVSAPPSPPLRCFFVCKKFLTIAIFFYFSLALPSNNNSPALPPPPPPHLPTDSVSHLNLVPRPYSYLYRNVTMRDLGERQANPVSSGSVHPVCSDFMKLSKFTTARKRHGVFTK